MSVFVLWRPLCTGLSLIDYFVTDVIMQSVCNMKTHAVERPSVSKSVYWVMSQRSRATVTWSTVRQVTSLLRCYTVTEVVGIQG